MRLQVNRYLASACQRGGQRVQRVQRVHKGQRRLIQPLCAVCYVVIVV